MPDETALSTLPFTPESGRDRSPTPRHLSGEGGPGGTPAGQKPSAAWGASLGAGERRLLPPRLGGRRSTKLLDGGRCRNPDAYGCSGASPDLNVPAARHRGALSRNHRLPGRARAPEGTATAAPGARGPHARAVPALQGLSPSGCPTWTEPRMHAFIKGMLSSKPNFFLKTVANCV